MRHDFSRKLNFECHVVDHCNLNCKSCSHYSSIAESYFCDLDDYKNDLERLSCIVPEGRIDKIRLLGGEPLLHPNISQFISIAYEIFPNVNRELVTNGIILNQMTEDFWKACKETETRIYVSRYPIKLDYDGIQNILIEKGIEHIVGVVPKSFDKHSINTKGDLYSIFSHFLCMESYGPYMQLKSGRLYKCPYVAYSSHLSKRFGLDISKSKRDSINIYNITSIEEIYVYLRDSIPFCSNCDIVNKTYMNKWDYSSFNISEWV